MKTCVLDASALLAFLQREKGHEMVEQALIAGAAISQVNLAEVVTKLSEAGMPAVTIYKVLVLPNLELVDFDTAMAYRAGLLPSPARQIRLSLEDRACLALAQLLKLPVLTTNSAWSSLKLGIVVQVIR
ncbi:MAG TPA: type II toxin-antitoxin system VapC family toxin [Ktedonobacteraceae bacterium]|nr:type II toxin-antitoxin system VapC family toxin [Ktedonobacteraceae bacterium]